VGPPLELAETLRPHGGRVTAALRAALRALDGAGGGLALEEHIMEASLALAATGEDLRRSADQLGAARPATRFEVLRRVLRARDFAEASLDRPLALDDLARAACLSPFHFHRSFAAVLGETPRAYVIRRRLERARELIATTGRPIGDRPRARVRERRVVRHDVPAALREGADVCAPRRLGSAVVGGRTHPGWNRASALKNRGVARAYEGHRKREPS
jgi:AraC-like DNA-binding protein